MIKHALLLSFVLILHGCANTTTPASHSDAIRRGDAYLQQANEALQADLLKKAQQLLQKGLQEYRRLDWQAGIIQTELALISLHIRQQQWQTAAQRLNQLKPNLSVEQPSIRLHWLTRQIAVALGQQQWQQVEDAWQNADALCAKRCPQQATLHNQWARYQLAQQKLPEAARAAQLALTIAGENITERANAHRVLAQVAFAQQQWAQAQQHYDSTLTLDQQSGRSDRIITTLQGLAAVAVKTGDAALAQHYQQRAQAVAAARPREP